MSGADSPTLHLVLLLLAVQMALTTGTCIAEYNSWDELGRQGKAKLAWLYVPYLGFGELSYPFPFVLGRLVCIGKKGRRWFNTP